MNRYIDLIFFVFVWAAIFIFIPAKRVWRLFPAGVVSLIIIIVDSVYNSTLNLEEFRDPMIPIFGASLFFWMWALGTGIFTANFLRPGFDNSIKIIIAFWIIARSFATVSLMVHSHIFLDGFTWWHEAIEDLESLITFIFIVNGMFWKRVNYNEPRWRYKRRLI